MKQVKLKWFDLFFIGTMLIFDTSEKQVDAFFFVFFLFLLLLFHLAFLCFVCVCVCVCVWLNFIWLILSCILTKK